jgi:2-polyprenyl-6-methoxyphenol hydroxylase-like FAD-dependent oxidoreductase
VALVGDAAFYASLMAGQGSALAITGAYVVAGELVKTSGRHEEAFRSYEAKTEGSRTFLLRLCSENPMGSIRAQSGGKSIHLSRTGEAGVRAKHYRQVAAAGLPVGRDRSRL